MILITRSKKNKNRQFRFQWGLWFSLEIFRSRLERDYTRPINSLILFLNLIVNEIKDKNPSRSSLFLFDNKKYHAVASQGTLPLNKSSTSSINSSIFWEHMFNYNLNSSNKSERMPNRLQPQSQNQNWWSSTLNPP